MTATYMQDLKDFLASIQVVTPAMRTNHKWALECVKRYEKASATERARMDRLEYGYEPHKALWQDMEEAA